MRYQQPTLQDQLAAEYVMGNLIAQARRRFEKLLIQYPEIQSHVAAWTARLQPLNEDLIPITPPAAVWKNIQAHIKPVKAPLWSNLVFWRSVGMVAASVALVISLLFTVGGTASDRVVLVMNKDAQPSWVVKTKTQSRSVLVQTIAPPNMPKNKVCVLWLVWNDGKTQSMGVLSDTVGKQEMRLPENMQRKIELAKVVVSIETRGKNIDKPQGEIVYNGPWVTL
jgi:anti-sigma-K factor RskA